MRYFGFEGNRRILVELNSNAVGLGNVPDMDCSRLGNLVDVDTARHSVNDVLVWDGKNWINKPFNSVLVETQSEVDIIEIGTGLSSSGAYSPNSSANYINTASSLKDADDKLDSAIHQLSTWGNDAINAINSNISTNTGDISTLRSDYNLMRTDLSTISGDITTWVNNIQSESTDRSNADTQLQNKINIIETSVGLGTNGNYIANTTGNYIKNANSLKDADNKLDIQLKDVTDQLSFRTLGSRVLAENTTSSTVRGQTYTRLSFPTITKDVNDEFTNGTTFTSKIAQTITVKAQVGIMAVSSTTASLGLYIHVNGNSVFRTIGGSYVTTANGSHHCTCSLSWDIDINAGDIVEIYAYHTDGSSNRSLDANSYLSISQLY